MKKKINLYNTTWDQRGLHIIMKYSLLRMKRNRNQYHRFLYTSSKKHYEDIPLRIKFIAKLAIVENVLKTVA